MGAVGGSIWVWVSGLNPKDFVPLRRNRIRWTPVNLGRLQEWVDAGRLDAGRVLTMRDLRDNGVVHKKIPHGVKLLAQARRALLRITWQTGWRPGGSG